MGEGGHVEQVLDEVGGAGLAQPQEQGVSVLQQEDARVGQTLLGAAQRGGRSFCAGVRVVLKGKKKTPLRSGRAVHPGGGDGGRGRTSGTSRGYSSSCVSSTPIAISASRWRARSSVHRSALPTSGPVFIRLFT